jgi:hypothetical protein
MIFTDDQPTAVFAEEEEQVWCWRFEQFVRLGFDDENACLLAESDADLNRARSLAAVGCPRPVALQILV